LLTTDKHYSLFWASVSVTKKKKFYNDIRQKLFNSMSKLEPEPEVQLLSPMVFAASEAAVAAAGGAAPLLFVAPQYQVPVLCKFPCNLSRIQCLV
jgi:hypothetical protein